MAMNTSTNGFIVDDHKTTLRGIRNLLKRIDSENVEDATDGGEALTKLEAGVSNDIVKPFNAETLRGKIQKVVGNV